MTIFAPPQSWGAIKPPPGAVADPSHPFQRGLRQHILFNEGVGNTVADAGPFRSRGTMNANMDPATDWVVTEKGRAVEFDGVDQNIGLPDLDGQLNTNTGHFTISFILRGAADADVSSISAPWCAEDTGTIAQLRWSGTSASWYRYFGFYNSGWTKVTFSSLPGNVWLHVVVTYDQVNMLGYLDGLLDASAASTRATHFGLEDVQYFGSRIAAANYWGGEMSDMRFWDRVLSPREVWELYRNPYADYRRGGTIWLPAGGTTHEVSASFGASSGLASTGAVSLEGALTFALSSAVTLSSVLQSDGAVGLATSSSVGLGATHQTGASSALGVSSGVSDSSDMIAETGLPLGVSGGLLGSVQLTSDVSASLGVDQGMQSVAGLSLDAAVSLAQDQGVSLSSLITIEGAVAFGASVAASASETVDYAAVLTLSQAPGIAASNVSVLQGVAVLSQSAGAAASGQANYAASVSVTISPGVVSASSLDQDVSVALAAALSEAITAATTNITAPVGRTISVQASGHTVSVAARTITIKPLAN